MILRFATHACGTRFELVLADAGPGAERRLRAAGGEALRAIEEVDRTWSLFRRDSLLARMNRQAARTPVPLDEDAYELLWDALAVWRASGGAFDPALAPRQRARGLHADSELGAAPPSDAAPGAEAVELDAAARTLRFRHPGVALDLGGIAKGHALDLAAAALDALGVERAFLHGGTSAALALGAPPTRPAWGVALEDASGARVELAGDAFALSSGAGRVDAAGDGHVLDRDGGRAAPRGRAAFALARSARLADAWATALVARPDLATTKRWPDGLAVGVAEAPGPGRRWLTAGDPALLERCFRAAGATPPADCCSSDVRPCPTTRLRS